MNKNKTYLFNTTIMTGGPGNYNLEKITLEEFKKIWLEAEDKESAIGHDATADLLSILLGETVKVNRQAVVQKAGDVVLMLKMAGRIPEGTILKDISQIEEVGYDLHKCELTQKREGGFLLGQVEYTRYGEPDQTLIQKEFFSDIEANGWIEENKDNFMEPGDGHGYVFFKVTDYVQSGKKFYCNPYWSKEFHPDLDLEPT